MDYFMISAKCANVAILEVFIAAKLCCHLWQELQM